MLAEWTSYADVKAPASSAGASQVVGDSVMMQTYLSKRYNLPHVNEIIADSSSLTRLMTPDFFHLTVPHIEAHAEKLKRSFMLNAVALR